MLRLAWSESSGLALQLATRFPSAKLKSDIRWLLLNFPEKVINEPSGLEVMLGESLPADVSFQLKVCFSPAKPNALLMADDMCSICCTGRLSTPQRL